MRPLDFLFNALHLAFDFRPLGIFLLVKKSVAGS